MIDDEGEIFKRKYRETQHSNCRTRLRQREKIYPAFGTSARDQLKSDCLRRNASPSI
jgi:hypothetical protein